MITPASINIRHADPGAIREAGHIIREGGLVAFPTETVYGLGADATNDQAVARIFEAKGRPSFNPLIVHVLDIEAAERWATVDDRARELAARFWPGGLTLVLPRRADGISYLASAGLATIAVRAPAHETGRALLTAADRPIAGPSANRSGEVSPTSAQHVAGSLGQLVDMVLDGGPCSVGVESTVLDLTGGDLVILRPGAVTREDIEALAGPVGVSTGEGDLKSPGMLARHYATRTPLRLDVDTVARDEALLAFGDRVPAGAAEVRNLSPSGDLREAAANLFAMLHELDRPDFSAIAVMPVPETGLGAAINDRLRRAAVREG